MVTDLHFSTASGPALPLMWPAQTSVTQDIAATLHCTLTFLYSPNLTKH